ncbi:MAG: hypothetical protein H0T15_02205 [Thermoleophilaceae bacterium]|nr:hypothetical protein [Thermoleophilaceae bacterium]
MSPAVLALVLLAIALALPSLIVGLRRLAARRPKAGAGRPEIVTIGDPGRERRAEQRARELLRSCVNDEEWAMYRDLGFLRIHGGGGGGGKAAAAAESKKGAAAEAGGSRYAYLIYPHKPITAYVTKSGRLLSEYCVEFPDLAGAVSGHGTRLPASDDVLAKWMALTGDEERLIKDANMHLPGRQLDPARVRRDLWRLAQWERERGAAIEARPR